MGDIVDRLRAAHQTSPIPSIASLYSNAADEIVDLRAEVALWREMYDMVAAADTRRSLLDRALRAERDADRLAAEVMRLRCACEPSSGYRCTKCVTLDLHDKEVEAR